MLKGLSTATHLHWFKVGRYIEAVARRYNRIGCTNKIPHISLSPALKTSIYQIVITFQGQLGEFVLASAYADRLRHFVEFDD